MIGREDTGAVAAVIAAWWGYVVADFAIHAAILERWWRSTAEFWLPVLVLAQRLPFAYSAFALYCAGLVWLMGRMRGPRQLVADGIKIGAVAGVAFGSVSALGMYSIVRMPVSFLLVVPISTAVCSGVAGGVAAWVSRGTRKWRRVGLVLAVAVAVFVVGVVAQNLLRDNHA